MKCELPFINEKNPQIHLLILLPLEKRVSESLVFYDWCGISVTILWLLPAEVSTFFTFTAKSNFSQECLDQIRPRCCEESCAVQHNSGSEAISIGLALWSQHLVKVPLVDRASAPLSLAPVGGSCQANLGRSVTQRTTSVHKKTWLPGRKAILGPSTPFTLPSSTRDTLWRLQVFIGLMSLRS